MGTLLVADLAEIRSRTQLALADVDAVSWHARPVRDPALAAEENREARMAYGVLVGSTASILLLGLALLPWYLALPLGAAVGVVGVVIVRQRLRRRAIARFEVRRGPRRSRALAAAGLTAPIWQVLESGPGWWFGGHRGASEEVLRVRGALAQAIAAVARLDAVVRNAADLPWAEEAVALRERAERRATELLRRAAALGPAPGPAAGHALDAAAASLTRLAHEAEQATRVGDPADDGLGAQLERLREAASLWAEVERELPRL